MAVSHQFNPKSTTIRRIRADLREMHTDPSDMYQAAPLEDNLFDWHFTIRGPPDTEFDGGVYHGRILLPTDYPFKPPNIVLLTPNGRFAVRKKICLSISAYHPETWLPAWGIRLILEALISFMPTEGEGAVGALDYSPEERRRLARASRSWECPDCGPVLPLLPELKPDAPRVNKYSAEISKMHMHAAPVAAAKTAADGAAAGGGSGDDGGGESGSGGGGGGGGGSGGAPAPSSAPSPAPPATGTAGDGPPLTAAPSGSAASTPAAPPTAGGLRPTVGSGGGPVGGGVAAPSSSPPASATSPPTGATGSSSDTVVTVQHPGKPAGDTCLGVLAWLLTAAIGYVLFRKLSREFGPLL